MNYLVTGGAGFIGSAVCKALAQKGNSLTTIDNLSTGSRGNIESWNGRFIHADTYDASVIETLSGEKFDAIIHIAGQSSGEVSFDDPVYDLKTNTQSTLMLLDMARKTGCRRFIYASSMSVYGDSNPPLCTEDTAASPKSFYAAGKLASENYMRIYSNNFGIACTALRFFNVYGEGQNMDNLRQGMASIYLAMALKNHHINVKGSGKRFRDFVYISDVVKAVLISLEREEGFEVFNVCTGVMTTVEEVVESIRKQLDFDVSVEYSEGTPGDQFGIYGSYEKIESFLGWKPEINFEQGISKMIQWALTL